MVNDYAAKIEKYPKLGYEYELLDISQHKLPLNVLKNDSCVWYEIDDIEDLNYAQEHIKMD